MSDKPKHLARYMHDVTCSITEIWCDAEWYDNATERMDDVTCIDCLGAAADYGDEARDRKAELQSKQPTALLVKRTPFGEGH